MYQCEWHTSGAVGAVSQSASLVVHFFSIFIDYLQYKLQVEFHILGNSLRGSPPFPPERVAATERNQLGSNMLTSLAKGIAAQGKRSMSTIRYAEYGHPLNVLKCVLSCVSRGR